jgi:integrase
MPTCTENTRAGRCRFARDFLEATFGAGPLAYDRITAELLLRYITEQAHRYQPGTVGVLVVALRSFLRFLQFDGVPTAVVAEVLPASANWRLAALPPSLSEDQLGRFWNAFDPSTAVGKRDFAMARCLADLALRCQEVADLSLASIDWRVGIVSLPHTKGLRADRMPLPQATGQALVDYLRHGRPPSTARALFLSHRAPLGAPVTHRTVRGAIRRAFARAGLPWTGTHVLRHTAATRLLQGGRSLKEVADVLRHRSLDTTVIYTKVDLPHLRDVALPWPEQQP